MRTKILDIIFFCFLFIIVGCSRNKEAMISQKENIIKDNIAGEIIESKEIEIKQEKKEDFIWKQQDGKFYNTAISFSYPKEWYFENFYGEDGTRVYFYEEKDKKQPVLSYEVGEAWRFDKNATKDMYYEMFSGDYKNFEIMDFSNFNIKGNIAHKLVFAYDNGGNTEIQIRYITSQDLLFHELCLFTNQENIELKKKELEELVDTIYFIDNAVPGKPYTEPEKRGWSIHHAKDVRENFSDIPVYPTEKTQDDIYLLGKTENFTLYGKGNHENLLLESNGCYSEIFYPYTSNYMHLPELYELDIDQDGVLELGIKLHLQKGTELSIHNLLLADFNEENELYVYQYQEEDFTEDLQRVIDFDDVERGIYLLLNGEKTGIYIEDKYENEPFTSIGVGAIMHFLYDDIKEGIWLTGTLLFERKGSVMYETNGSAVKALVGWNGKEFFLSQYQVVLDGEK